VGAVDGIEICSSFARCCDACMEREIAAQGERRNENRDSVLSPHRRRGLGQHLSPSPWGFAFRRMAKARSPAPWLCCKIWSGSWAAASWMCWWGTLCICKRLSSRSGTPGSGSGPFTLKENQPELLREAERCTQDSPTAFRRSRAGRFNTGTCRTSIGPSPIAGCGSSKQFASKTSAASRSAKKTLLAPKARRKGCNRAPTSTPPISNWVSISPLFIHQFSRSRWRIDTEVFQTITTDCHLKHPAVHQTTALVVLTMIRFLAYTLSLVFYHRQVRSHARRKCETFHEFAKRLAYWFVALSPNTS
jgi:hypothetical protein